MTIAFAAADFAGSDRVSNGVTARITAAVAAAMTRAKAARHDCRQLLACDEILRDAGVTRDDVRQMLMGTGRL